MPKYLQLAEVPSYCEYFTDITEVTIDFAESLIDSYLGESLMETTDTWEGKLSRKNTGKLEYSNVTQLMNASAVYKTPTGFQESPVDINSIRYDKNGYFEYVPFMSALSINTYLGYPMYSIKIEYKHGYSTVPSNLKRAVAMVCQNMSEKKTFGNLKSYTTIDVQMALFDDSVFTKDIRMLLDCLK
jgi:hypothetical protein